MGNDAVINQRILDEPKQKAIIANLIPQVAHIIPEASPLSSHFVGKGHRDLFWVLFAYPDAVVD